jgi:hypothetical protein
VRSEEDDFLADVEQGLEGDTEAAGRRAGHEHLTAVHRHLLFQRHALDNCLAHLGIATVRHVAVHSGTGVVEQFPYDLVELRRATVQTEDIPGKSLNLGENLLGRALPGHISYLESVFRVNIKKCVPGGSDLLKLRDLPRYD